jgi:hypothetical protein
VNLRSLIEYAWYKVFTPQVHDFVSMGMGIEYRYQKLYPWWSSHLESSRAVQREALALLSSSSEIEITILGSGRLYDVEPAVFNDCAVAHLYDYDPRSIEYCKRRFPHRPALYFHCEDITGSMCEWTSRLKEVSGAKSDELVVDVLRGLRGVPPEVPGNLVISLNILGQLGIYWMDRVYQLLGSQVTDKIEGALQASLERLELEHIEMLFASGATVIVIITDERYHFYGAETNCVEALTMSLDALIARCPAFVEKYQQYSKRTWGWHVQPWGLENRKWGETPSVHQVTGEVFVRNDRYHEIVRTTKEERR